MRARRADAPKIMEKYEKGGLVILYEASIAIGPKRNAITAKGMWNSKSVSGKIPTPATPKPAIPRGMEKILSLKLLKQKYADRRMRIPQRNAEPPNRVAVGPTPKSLM